MPVRNARVLAIALFGAALLPLTAALGALSGATPTQLDQALSDWPAGPQLAARVTAAKYGQPQEVTSERIIWREAGPFKRITVTREEVPHDFPKPHLDVIEHVVGLSVPVDRVDDIARFDGSVTVDRTAGEVSSRGELESRNILALNIAGDIAAGRTSPGRGREVLSRYVLEELAGKRPAYAEGLRFTPRMQGTGSADRPVIPGAPERVALHAADGTPIVQMAGTASDPEALAWLLALDENGIRAADLASRKKLRQALLDFASMLRLAHGNDAVALLELARSQRIVPADTPEVGKLRAKGAGELARIAALDHEAFEKAFLDAMIKSHSETLLLLDEQVLPSTRNAAIRKQLAGTRARVAQHLDQAKLLQSERG